MLNRFRPVSSKANSETRKGRGPRSELPARPAGPESSEAAGYAKQRGGDHEVRTTTAATGERRGTGALSESSGPDFVHQQRLVTDAMAEVRDMLSCEPCFPFFIVVASQQMFGMHVQPTRCPRLDVCVRGSSSVVVVAGGRVAFKTKAHRFVVNQPYFATQTRGRGVASPERSSLERKLPAC